MTTEHSDALVTTLESDSKRNYAGGQRIRCGIDIVELAQFGRDLKLGGSHFLARVFTDAELRCCRGDEQRLAARFAAKEAASKALGTGMRGVGWHDFEVVATRCGQPVLHLWGRAAEQARVLGITAWSLSLTHSSLLAAAFVVATQGRAADDGTRVDR